MNPIQMRCTTHAKGKLTNIMQRKIVIDFDAGKNKQYFVLKVKQLSNECHFSEKCHLPKLFKKPSSQLALNTKKV
ncbi:hypothetical protein T4D_10047 [Trichinella pseudospiralis]|uniref:Uncharacterized protein n=1 Tax=Trichinella pseudospiralis TaxID=6337 RepID=A0A0V1FVX7_TRIPS|nr:hypothetical protein T4D_10047 [Trichinella pseudospiralis]